MLSAALTFNIKDDVSVWLREDCPKLDIGGFVVGEKMETATLFCKSSTVLAGVPFANEVYSQCNLSVIWHVEEGCPILIHGDVKKVAVATVRGKAKDILLAERVSLNTLSRASGIATAARKAADIKSAQSWEGYVAGTRKTTPGFAAVEKYALLVGGVATHRMDLSQMVMLKDNHIWSAGSITNAVKKARTVAGFSMKIEVECQDVEEALEACAAGADIVMLDNFDHTTIGAAAQAIKERHPHVLVEASGHASFYVRYGGYVVYLLQGISEEAMHLYMLPCVDIISRGSLTQGYSCADFSLKINVTRA